MTEQMHRVALARRPNGDPVPEDFSHEAQPMPTPGEGEVLVQVTHMSLDPYMRGRMDDVKSYADPVPLGGTMEAGTVGVVLQSNHPRFAAGDLAFGMFGWASHGVLPGNQLRKLDPAMGKPETALGVLGMPGFTAWAGMTAYGKMKAGETLVVGAATGPVGSMVGQLAKQAGLRVIGIAGGADKCKIAVDTFGFDACIDHRENATAKEMQAVLAEHCPDGVDIYFENVGGKVLEAVIPLMNPFGRIPICGMIAWYNAGGLGENAGGAGLTAPKLWRTILVNFLSVNGFIISNHWDRFPEFIREVAPKVASGEIAVQEDITEGLENAPQAFINLLTGGNTGKAIVKVS